MKTECPSCGNIIIDNQAFCPMCGTKIEYRKKESKKINKELESLLFTANTFAETYLSKEIVFSDHNKFDTIESKYLKCIQEYPTECKAYLAYVDYIIKFISRMIESPTRGFFTEYYNIDLIVTRCRNYLVKAKEVASDDELEEILQLDSLFSAEIEKIAHNETIHETKKQAEEWKAKEDKKLQRLGQFFVWIIILSGVAIALSYIFE